MAEAGLKLVKLGKKKAALGYCFMIKDLLELRPLQPHLQQLLQLQQQSRRIAPNISRHLASLIVTLMDLGLGKVRLLTANMLTAIALQTGLCTGSPVTAVGK